MLSHGLPWLLSSHKAAYVEPVWLALPWITVASLIREEEGLEVTEDLVLHALTDEQEIVEAALLMRGRVHGRLGALAPRGALGEVGLVLLPLLVVHAGRALRSLSSVRVRAQVHRVAPALALLDGSVDRELVGVST